jgi:hypothetical protein
MRGSPTRRPRARERYFLTGLIACLIFFVAGFVGIQKAPARSGLSDTLGWIIVLSLAGAALSLSLLISAALERARIGQVARLVRCPECGGADY